LKRAVFLLEVRDLWPYFAIAVGVLRQPILIRLSEWLERALIRGADQIVVNSPGFVDHISERGGREIAVVPNGVDPNMFPKDVSGSAFRQQYRLDDRFIVMYTGAHGLSNDLEVLLEAARLVQGRQEEIHFVLVGDGKEKGALQVSAQGRELRNVTFVPPVPKVEIAETLAAAQVCVAILRPIQAYTTTYPNKVFDYMAAGRPILLAIDGAIREVVETAGAGIFVPPGDPLSLSEAVLQMFESPEECHQMGQRGRAYVSEHFDRVKLAGQMEKIMVAACEKQSDEDQGIEPGANEVGR
jgi:glycosyltransferase involved in cell wall biosynthesis